jgi:uncharacterized protein YbbC (DUF1343 family)
MRAHRLAVIVVGLSCSSGTRAPSPAVARVRPGIEVLLTDSIHLIAGKRLGLLSNHTGIDRERRRDVDLLRATHGARLTVLFSPEHGFAGVEDRTGLPDGRDSATGLPIYSLYGGSRTAARAAFDSLDVLLVDMQDIGARFYTYIKFTATMMRDATQAGKPVIVLDRPNPIGSAVGGNVRAHVTNPDTTPVGFLPVAMRHGMTLGELARMANDVLGLGAELTVVPAAGWNRNLFYDETQLPWVRPSPNIPDLESALHYAGLCLFEGTNVSVGRGTDFAFQVLGAPWLNAAAVIATITSDTALTGFELRPTTFTPLAPTDFKYAGEALPGIRIRVVDRQRYDPTRLAVALLAAIRASNPAEFRFTQRFDMLAATPDLRLAIEAGKPPSEVWRTWAPDLARFREIRAKYLLY